MKRVNECVNDFFQSWKDQNWEEMYNNCQVTWKDVKKQSELEKHFDIDGWRIKDFKVTGFTNFSSTKKTFMVELTFADGRIENHAAIVICEAAPYKPAPYGAWGVNPVSVVRNFGTIKKATKKAKNEGKK
jgi:hypothetical protein